MRALVLLVFLFVPSGHANAFDLQGHRGARGLLPENTLPAFSRALELGANTLETDLAVTRDGILVLSHDPLLNPAILRGPDGQWIKDHTLSIRSLSLAELKAFDAGRLDPASSYAAKFPRQIPMDHTPIPTLSELFALMAQQSDTVRFNIETKITPDRPEETPDPETFARLVVEEVRRAGVAKRTSIQSFDWRALIAAKKLAPDIRTVCLTMDTDSSSTVRGAEGAPSPWLAGLDPAQVGDSIPKLVKAAGCDTWSPLFTNLTAGNIREAHDAGLLVVPWTVNTAEDMADVIALGVDGLITDYPNIARSVLTKHGIVPQ